MNIPLLRGSINEKLSMHVLLRDFLNVDALPGFTLHCPFHNDGRKSAKFFPDNAIFCYAESKMYRPFDLLIYIGMNYEEIADRYGVDLNFKLEKRILYKGINEVRAKLWKNFSIPDLVTGWLSLEEK